ncbi:MAG: aldo/keto reductase [Gudongella sp.]|nr:aldo/keto reductase [Gudongella sp.]
MYRRKLGRTDIPVSGLCFGSLTMTPFQANLTFDEGAALIKYAYDKGINFIDTAEIYDNYEYIRRALKEIPRHDYVIASKSYAYTEELAQESLEKALKELDTDYIDIFLLHEQESEHTIRGHWPAVEYFLKAKEKGLIRAIGISTHRVEGVRGFLKYKELDVVHPLLNIEGIGIHDGTAADMVAAIRDCHNDGRGVYSMKPLGGGHLIAKTEEAFRFVRDISEIDSVAIGLQSFDEVDAALQMLNTGSMADETKTVIKKANRRLVVADYCQACGNCVARCQQGGINIVDGQATPNENCILCGYCATVCPEFCIKVV